jgi:hypothetical protein
MRTIYLLFLTIILLKADAQNVDTLSGYKTKILGDEIKYYSPLHEFASTALLTRANGKMPIEWYATTYTGNAEYVCYEILIAHSTGTSGGIRNFELSLNKQTLLNIQTQQKQTKGNRNIVTKNKISSSFTIEDQDINNDAFGRLFLTIPAHLVKNKAEFKLIGLDSNSRDWMMVFMYSPKFSAEIQVGNLLLRNQIKRKVNIHIDNPYNQAKLEIKIDGGIKIFSAEKGYNEFSFAAYDTSLIGKHEVELILNNKEHIRKTVELYPFKNTHFHIIHHSHNDIGYSHHQTEVEKIQNNNIVDAINWIESHQSSENKPIWHVESLWAVENFFRIANEKQIQQFILHVKNGQLVLSGNYANILTGLCRPEEQNWALEYANYLRKTYQFPIDNIMTTDIPGLSSSAFKAYLKNGYKYLSFGPNYVQTQAHLGDRVGGVIKEQGDKIFYWKENPDSTQKLLVWTAGKGYSYFHGITENQKQSEWEKRISDYVLELEKNKSPFDLVQLRYTKNADNGPVDQNLSEFVKKWNETYAAPTLKLSSIPVLFKEFEDKYSAIIPEETGEITPYWEDGAYSTALEEIEIRRLVSSTIQFEKTARELNLYEKNKADFYNLHKSIILFHEHTWGSWCSVSDPEIPFTTEQWKYKRAFLDSANKYYNKIVKIIPREPEVYKNNPTNISVKIDSINGGILLINAENKTLPLDLNKYNLLQPIYSLGINPIQHLVPKLRNSRIIKESETMMVVEQVYELKNFTRILVRYDVWKKGGKIHCNYAFYKNEVKEKEALHVALNFQNLNTQLIYNNGLRYPDSQLPGSNKEFICVEDAVKLDYKDYEIQISSPDFALFEIGAPIDENQLNGAKVWKRENQNPSTLFLYVLNNYWHTNYKAYQKGYFNFSIDLEIKMK